MRAAATILCAAAAAATPPPSVLDVSRGGNGMAAAAAVGLINRHLRRPAAFLEIRGSDPKWLSEALAAEPALKGANVTKVSLEGVIAEAVRLGAAQAVVLYNRSESWSLPTVVTLCGIHGAIPVESASEAPSLPVAFDARGRWADDVAATEFARGELLPLAAAGGTMVIQTPGCLDQGYIVDLAVAQRLFVVFADSLCSGLTGSALYKNITNNEHWAGKQLSIMGYNAKMEVLSVCEPTRSVISISSDYVSSLSFHALLEASPEKMAQPPPLPVGVYNASKTYVAIVRSDGDNLQIVMDGERAKMEERLERCAAAAPGNVTVACPPISWTMSNRLVDFAPDVLRWWYAAAATTGRDSFLMGPSGYGYLYPAQIQSADTQKAFAAATAAAAGQLGMEGYVHWDLPSPGRVETFLKLLSGTAVRGVFIDPTGGVGVPDAVGGVGVVKHTSLDAGAVSRLPAGGFHFVYQIWDQSLDDLSTLAAGVSEHVELVGYRELLALQRQAAALSG